MHSLRGSEPTALEAVGCEWRYALLVVQARKDNDYDDDDDCIESTIRQESVRPRWPYDMRPSVRTEKYIRDASG